MNIRNLALTVCVVLALSACAMTVPLQRAQIGSLSREAPPAEVDRILGTASVVATAEFVAIEKPYLARQYLLQTGSRQEVSVVCTPTCIPIFVTVPVMTEYVVIQRMPSKELHAWGTFEELSKDTNSEVSSIMPIDKAQLAGAKKKH